MFKVSNNIIIVDDQQKELDLLSQAFLDKGIGCRPLLYDNSYFEPLSNIRIAFFDLNIGEKKVDDSGKTPEEVEKLNSGVYNDLALAINQYIDKQNGPFALIFWTKNKKIIDGFIKYIQNPERGFSDTPFPILINCIDKDEFITNTSIDNLSEKLLEILNLEEIKFLFNFEKQASEAAEKTINKLYKVIPKDKNWGENTILFDSLGKILSKIAASTLGFEHSKENPNKAVFEGLLPILNNEILTSESEVDWKKILIPLYAANNFKEVISPDDLIQRKVNSIFHLENNVGEKDVRGNVVLLDKTNSEILNSLNINDINVWFNKLIPFRNDKKNLKRSVRNNSRLIAIELSAACDFSNRKERINKYAIGFITPCINLKEDIDHERRIESSYHLGGCDFNLEEEDFQIWLNLNFVFGAKSDDPRLGESLFIMKKEIMDMLGNKYASHVSRIGITSF
jgi:hypothetical protein